MGDLLIVDNSQLEELIPAGLIMDLTDKIKNTKYLSQYVDNHFKPFNAAFQKVNPDGKIYALPTFEADTSPTTFSEQTALLQPDNALGLLQGSRGSQAEQSGRSFECPEANA